MFWVLAMNPNRWPICRTRIAQGALITTRIQVRDVFLPLLLAEAKSFAILRTQPNGNVRLNLADRRLLYLLRQTSRSWELI
jgi:hypothetical protein